MPMRGWSSPNGGSGGRWRPPWRRAGRLTVRGAVIGLLLSALLAFALVSAVSVQAARTIARHDALAEASRSAHASAQLVFAPELPGLLAGDPASRVRLDAAVRLRKTVGDVVRVKVWDLNGTVLYSDDPWLVGQRFPLDGDVEDCIQGQASTAELTDQFDEENIDEPQDGPLVEVYTPLNLADGRRYAFEMYSTADRVLGAQRQLTAQLVPLSLGALLVLLLTQLPIGVSLIRRVARAQAERARLLRSALAASDRERRIMARDLHDGVVQELSGAGYALQAVAGEVGQSSARDMIHTVAGLVQRCVGTLRTLIVDVYPPDLTATGLCEAFGALAKPLRGNGIEVTIRCEPPQELSSDVSATLYRCARELLTNVAKHAGARTVSIDLAASGGAVRLEIADDGVGVAGAAAAGHLGLRLLRDALADLGGALDLSARPGGGTLAAVELPVTAAAFV
jgi:two-component system, NarL family, sensor kinase